MEDSFSNSTKVGFLCQEQEEILKDGGTPKVACLIFFDFDCYFLLNFRKLCFLRGQGARSREQEERFCLLNRKIIQQEHYSLAPCPLPLAPNNFFSFIGRWTLWTLYIPMGLVFSFQFLVFRSLTDFTDSHRFSKKQKIILRNQRDLLDKHISAGQKFIRVNPCRSVVGTVFGF